MRKTIFPCAGSSDRAARPHRWVRAPRCHGEFEPCVLLRKGADPRSELGGGIQRRIHAHADEPGSVWRKFLLSDLPRCERKLRYQGGRTVSEPGCVDQWKANSGSSEHRHQLPGFEQVGITPPEGRNDVTGVLTDIFLTRKGNTKCDSAAKFARGVWMSFTTGTRWGTSLSTGAKAHGQATRHMTVANIGAGRLSRRRHSGANISVGNAERKVTVNAFSLFAGDSWQATSNLSMTFGFVTSISGPCTTMRRIWPVFIPGRGLVIQGNGIGSIFPPDRNNFAPRFGFAYKPPIASGLVVRGGVGVFFDQINMNPFLDYRPPNGAADGLQGNPAGPITGSQLQD